MSSDNNPRSQKNQTITDRFAKSALTYDSHAKLQQEIAKTLANCLPHEMPDKILEIGCGTGLLTRHIIDAYPEIPFTITDITPEMLSVCMQKYHTLPWVKFAVLDGESITKPQNYDLIASSMTIHWFDDILTGLKNIQTSLTRGGEFYFTTIGPDCFPEWRAALHTHGFEVGIRRVPDLPGIFHRETLSINHHSPLDFLKSLSRLGAHTPHRDYTPLTRKQLRSAMATLDKEWGSTVTWEILYGKIIQL